MPRMWGFGVLPVLGVFSGVVLIIGVRGFRVHAPRFLGDNYFFFVCGAGWDWGGGGLGVVIIAGCGALGGLGVVVIRGVLRAALAFVWGSALWEGLIFVFARDYV